jgi:hypothetical protein
LLGALAGVDLVVRSEQHERWDFPAVVDLYRQTAGAAAKAIPGLVPLPPAETLDPARCTYLALEAVANTQVGPRGAPWHLNVLGVTLRDVAVEEVIFRDLGTLAAPVLAAVTLERK